MEPALESPEPILAAQADPAESRYLAERALVEQRIGSDSWKKIDALEDWLLDQPEVQRELPVKHIFTPGLYAREVYMFQGALGTTNIHLTCHPFVISQGVVSVWTDETGWQLIRAPFTGITKPGTRRVLYIHEDTVWTTFHVTDETDPEEIMRQITQSPLSLE